MSCRVLLTAGCLAIPILLGAQASTEPSFQLVSIRRTPPAACPPQALCIGAIAIIAIANLRGVKESGRVFAVPTYAYIISLALLLVVGLSKSFLGDLGRIPESPERLEEIRKNAANRAGLSGPLE